MKKLLLNPRFSFFNDRFASLVYLHCILLSLFWQHSACAHFANLSATMYVNQYKDLAIDEMNRTLIPASIKLGQAILESSYGGSKLATEGNNHFGIKCKSYWLGETILIDDDTLQECFRKYQSVEDSYFDHSEFLKSHREGYYSVLFQYSCSDYKSWAEGLQALGYATNPNYAKQLIDIIERNNLSQYDCYTIADQNIEIERITDNRVNRNQNDKQNIVRDTISNKVFVPKANAPITNKPLSDYSNNDKVVASKLPDSTPKIHSLPSNNETARNKVKHQEKTKPVPNFVATGSDVKQNNLPNDNYSEPDNKRSQKKGNASSKKAKPVPDFVACPTCEVKPLPTSDPRGNAIKKNESNKAIVPPPTPPSKENKVIAPQPPPPSIENKEVVKEKPITTDELRFENVVINGVKAMIANVDINLGFLAYRNNLKKEKLVEFNEIESDIDIKAGTPIFLETKKQKSAAGIEVHVVQAGQSLFEIAQKYGMKLKTLCKINDMNPGYLPKEGTILKLR
jgi:hypothetical protein